MSLMTGMLMSSWNGVRLSCQMLLRILLMVRWKGLPMRPFTKLQKACPAARCGTALLSLHSALLVLRLSWPLMFSTDQSVIRLLPPETRFVKNDPDTILTDYQHQIEWHHEIRKIKWDCVPQEVATPMLCSVLTRPTFMVVHLFSGWRRQQDVHWRIAHGRSPRHWHCRAFHGHSCFLTLRGFDRKFRILEVPCSALWAWDGGGCHNCCELWCAKRNLFSCSACPTTRWSFTYDAKAKALQVLCSVVRAWWTASYGVIGFGLGKL